RRAPRPAVPARLEAGERGRTPERRRELAIDLRPGPDLSSRYQVVENPAEALGGEVFEIVVIDLRPRPGGAPAEALDLDPRQLTVGGNALLGSDPLVTDLDDLVRPAQQARRRAAELDVEFSDRLQIEHGVEGRDFERADLRHAEEIGDVLDRLLREPAAGLLLRPPQQRDDGGGLPAFRVPADLVLGPVEILDREEKFLRLQLGRGKAADGHQRSTSPNTMSSEPRIAAMSASM